MRSVIEMRSLGGGFGVGSLVDNAAISCKLFNFSVLRKNMDILVY